MPAFSDSMDANRYYFPNVIEDETLSILAVQAKELMQQNDEIPKMFRMNNKILNSIHPGDVLTFMKEINKSMFSSDSSIEDGINLAQSYKRPSSPKKLDPDDEAHKEKLRSATLDFVTPIRRRKLKAQPVSPTIYKTGKSDEKSPVGTPSKLESPRSAEITKMVSRLAMDEKELKNLQAIAGIIEAIGQESPSPSKMAKMTSNLPMDEKDFESPKKVIVSAEASSQESPRSAQITKMTSNLTMEEKEFETPKKVIGSVKAIKQESLHTAQIAKVAKNLSTEQKEFESPKKVADSIEESNQESHRSCQTPKMTANLTKEEKEFDSPAKAVGSIDASSPESPCPSVILQTTPNINMGVQESKSPVQEVYNIKLRNQESPQSHRTTSSPAKVTGASKRKNEESAQSDEKPTISDLPIPDKEYASHVTGDQAVCYSESVTDSPNAEENAGKSDNRDSHSKSHVEIITISEPAIIEGETPSPVKKSKISSIPTLVTQQYASPSKDNKIAENLPENTQATVSPIADAVFNISPIESLKGIAREDRKRKSLSPTRSKEPIKQATQESPRSAELTMMTSSLTVEDKKSKNLIQDQKVGISAPNKDSPNPKEDASKLENPDSSNKCSVSHAEVMETSGPVLTASEIPSPVQTFSIPTVVIQEFSSPAEKVEMAEKSPEDHEVTFSRTPSDESDTSLNEEVKKLVRYDRKRQSLSPKKRTKTLFKSIPKVIKLSGEEEIDIEVVDLEYDASPTTPRSKSADYKSDPTKDIPVQDKPKPESSPKTLEPSLKTDQSCKSEARSEGIKTKNLSLAEAIREFNIVLEKRDKRVKKLYIIFLSFQSSINYIKSYVFNISSILMQLDISGKYTDVEFKGTLYNANIVTIKLIKKIKSWKKDLDEDADTWLKCFHQIEQLKAKYAPLLKNEGEPAVTFETVQRYESEVRAIWKKMGNMIILGDSKRAAFSYIASDIETLAKMLVKCLILVGILLPR